MSEYLDNEAQVDTDEKEEEDQDSEGNYMSSDNESSVIDDNVEGNDLSFYRSFDNSSAQHLENVGDVENILYEELNEQYKAAENLEPNNLLNENEVLQDDVELKNQNLSLKHFRETFYPLNDDDNDDGNLEPKCLTFKEALQYAVRFFKLNLKTTCENFEEDDNVANQFDDDIKIEMDLNKFENTCYQINELLSKENLFLRVYEIKNSYREIRLKKSENTKRTL